MSNKINVILVDDHEMVRLGLKSFLNLQGGRRSEQWPGRC